MENPPNDTGPTPKTGGAFERLGDGSLKPIEESAARLEIENHGQVPPPAEPAGDTTKE